MRVMVVDDHPDVRYLIRMIVKDAGPGIEVAGEAAGAREALERLAEVAPDVVVLDARMRLLDGYEAAAMLLERRPGLPILLCSAIVDDDVRARAGRAGIAACLPKDDFGDIPRVALELAGRGGGLGGGAGPAARLGTTPHRKGNEPGGGVIRHAQRRPCGSS